MTNELIFAAQATLIALSTLIALRLGKEALIAFICVQCILANLFVIKQTTLCGLTATCADAFSIGAVLGLNLLQEYWGKETAKKTIALSFFILIFYALVSYEHLAFVPHAEDSSHEAFCSVLSFAPRIIAASFVVYAFVQYLDTIIYGFLKHALKGRYLALRIGIATMLSQLLDTVLFTFIGLYGIIANPWDIIVVSYLIKLAALGIALPFVTFAQKHTAHQK
jgi:uncharacterized integral membrane protein (TIGR00697 family)